MTNETVILFYVILASIVGITVIISLVQRGMRRVTGIFHLFSGCVLGWLVSDIAYYSATAPDAMRFLYDVKIVFAAFAPVTVLVLVLRFYQLDRVLTTAFKLWVCVIPAVTSVLALSSRLHPLLRSHLEILQIEPLHLLDMSRGPWYWVHTAYSYSLILAAMAVVAVQHHRLPSGYRAPSFVLVMAILTTIAGNVLHFLPVFDLDFDITLVGMSLSVVFVYVAVASSSQTDLLEIARDEIFNYLDEYVFILSLTRQVVDANRTARAWLTGLGIEPVFPMSFVHLIDVLRARGATIREGEDPKNGTDIYYVDNDQVFVYNLKERFVQDKKGKPVGVYSTLFDITRYRTLIDQLVKTVDIDTLTGIANRKVYEEGRLLHDADRTMPMSVILGDVNELKQVNDVYGHHEGDTLLRLVAQQLKQNCPARGLAARIGGDEFAIFLPGMYLNEAEAVISQVERGLQEQKGDHPFTPSIALGAAERAGPDEPIEAVVARADETMYTKKKNDRRLRVWQD